MRYNNPYTAGDPVGKTAAFVGRADVLRDVVRVLRHPSQNAITLYGQRRIGKTSVLQYLEAHLPEEGPYRPVYFDLMNETGLPLGEILQHLARTIALRLDLPDPDLGQEPERAFRKIFLPQALQSLPEASSLVLLLDEFDVLADPKAEQAAKRRFFGYLRELRLLDPRRLQFVFVLGRNVADLDIVAQGLFKDLPARRVSLLSREDAEAVVRLSERNGTLCWEEAAVERVWELTSGHPYLTQALCLQVWEAAYEEEEDEPPPVGPEAVEAAVPATLDYSRNMFEWLWGGLGPAERVAAAALAEAGPVVLDEEQLTTILAESGISIMIRELRDAPRILEEWDILKRVNGGYRFRVELIRRWVAANKPLSRVQDELDRLNPVADSLFNAAQGLYSRNDLEQAEALLQQALGLNPNHIRAHELLAEILLSQGNLDEAERWLEELEELAPGRARSLLKQLYLRRAEAAESDKEALPWYEKVLALYPGDPQAEEGRRRIYRQQGERDLETRDSKDLLHNGMMESRDMEQERIEPQQYEEILNRVKMGNALWLVGHSSMGKTTLLQWLGEKCRELGYTVHHWNNWDEALSEIVAERVKTIKHCLSKQGEEGTQKCAFFIEEFDNALRADGKEREEVINMFTSLKSAHGIGHIVVVASYHSLLRWQQQFSEYSPLLEDTFEPIALVWRTAQVKQLWQGMPMEEQVIVAYYVIKGMRKLRGRFREDFLQLYKGLLFPQDHDEYKETLEEYGILKQIDSQEISGLRWRLRKSFAQLRKKIFHEHEGGESKEYAIASSSLQELLQPLLSRSKSKKSGKDDKYQHSSGRVRREEDILKDLREFISERLFRDAGGDLRIWEVKSLYGYLEKAGAAGLLPPIPNDRMEERDRKYKEFLMTVVGLLLIVITVWGVINLLGGF